MLRITDASIRLAEKPEFSWILEGDEDQIRYELKVMDRYDSIFWTSGQVDSYERHNIPCRAELKDEETYYFYVCAYGSKGSTAEYKSEKFHTKINGFTAQWVEPNRTRKPLTDKLEPVEPIGRGHVPKDSLDKLDPLVYLRKEFSLSEIPEHALIYCAAHGIYSLYINGKRVSNLFDPGNTSYNKHIDYQCYDVTSLLNTGENVIAAGLGDGWYTGKISALGIGQQYGTESAFLAELILKGSDGTRKTVITDETVKWSEGAIRYADLYIGEYYDSACEIAGWNEASYVEGESWKDVCVKDFGYEELSMQTIPGIKEIRTIRPEIKFTPAGDMILDAGENIVGYVSFCLDMNEGDIVTMEHSETLDKDGNYIQNIIGQNKDQMDYFASAKSGKNIYKPEYTFHGFRYVRVNGTKDTNPEHYTIHVIGTPLRKTGDFECSDERLNKLQEIICRSQLGNMISIPTDCPQRERTGWLGDMQVFAPTGCYEYDIEQFIRHWMVDIRNEQLPDGQVPHITPCMKSHDIMKPPGITEVSAAGWSDAAVIIPWRLYEAYGDANILKENFELMKDYMASTERLVSELPKNYDELDDEHKAVQKYLWNTGFQYGDWLLPSIQMSGNSIFEVVVQTGHIVATLMLIITAEMMTKICEILDEEELAAHYREYAAKVKNAFAVEYVNDDGTLTKEYQGVYVLALKAGAIPEKLRENALNRLVTMIHANNDLLDTGFLSVAYLLPVLKECGRKDIANMLLFRDECPSWLYEVKMGATTMWEYWNGYAPDGTPSDCSMNHFAFGCVGEYLFRDIAGFVSFEPGRREMCFEPDTDCGLDRVKARYETVWGAYESEWKKEGEKITLSFVIPPNAIGKVHIKDFEQVYGCGRYTVEI